MEFQEFWKERARMCKQYEDCRPSCFGEACLIAKLDSYRIDCSEIIKRHPVEAEQIVEKWAKEHPVVTNADKFKETFGVPIGSYGAPCPSALTIYEIGTMSNNDWLNVEYQPPEGEER